MICAGEPMGGERAHRLDFNRERPNQSRIHGRGYVKERIQNDDDTKVTAPPSIVVK